MLLLIVVSFDIPNTTSLLVAVMSEISIYRLSCHQSYNESACQSYREFGGNIFMQFILLSIPKVNNVIET